jgi:hypothetical protein
LPERIIPPEHFQAAIHSGTPSLGFALERSPVYFCLVSRGSIVRTDLNLWFSCKEARPLAFDFELALIPIKKRNFPIPFVVCFSEYLRTKNVPGSCTFLAVQFDRGATSGA